MWAPFNNFRYAARSSSGNLASHCLVRTGSTHSKAAKPGLWDTWAATTLTQAHSILHCSSARQMANREKLPKSSTTNVGDRMCHPSNWRRVSSVAEIPLVAYSWFPRANSHNAGWTTSGTPQSLTIRRVCKTVQKCRSVAGRSTIPRCTIALHPDPSAAKPFMAPDRKLENVCSETVVEAMACKPLGQAATRIARIFSSYGDADNFSLGHMDCSAWIRTIWVALVCLRVVWTCAPNMRQLSTTVKPWSRRHWRPWLLVDHTKVFFWSKRRSNASMNWVRQWKMSRMRVGSVVMIVQSSTYEIGHIGERNRCASNETGCQPPTCPGRIIHHPQATLWHCKQVWSYGLQAEIAFQAQLMLRPKPQVLA